MNNIEVKKLTKEEFEDFILMKKIEDTSLEEITEFLLNQSYLVMFWQQVYEQQKEEIERLNSIIKEVREYIETQQIIFKEYDIAMENQLKNILEILDKAGEKND